MSENCERALAKMLVASNYSRQREYSCRNIIPIDGCDDHNRYVWETAERMFPTKPLIVKYNISVKELDELGVY